MHQIERMLEQSAVGPPDASRSPRLSYLIKYLIIDRPVRAFLIIIEPRLNENSDWPCGERLGCVKVSGRSVSDAPPD